MLIIEPDFDHLIDLPGAGPTPCPVALDSRATGFTDLGSLQVHELGDRAAIDGETGEDEMLIVLLAGAMTVAVTGPQEDGFQLDADGDWAIYLPPHHVYRLEPLVPATVAQARARSSAASSPRAFRPLKGLLLVEEPAERLRLRLLPLEGETDASAGLDETTERLVHLTGPATVRSRTVTRNLPPGHTLALAPGESAMVTGEGEILVVAALGPPR
ncbi:5-deoxy-glucuronate isomerase [Rubellimicrobium rubrum]|nr:5-deoxy-glucuronate isomerase [Rubellimicrobium rubrum]